jgi:hypothetical protein
MTRRCTVISRQTFQRQRHPLAAASFELTFRQLALVLFVLPAIAFLAFPQVPAEEVHPQRQRNAKSKPRGHSHDPRLYRHRSVDSRSYGYNKGTQPRHRLRSGVHVDHPAEQPAGSVPS